MVGLKKFCWRLSLLDGIAHVEVFTDYCKMRLGKCWSLFLESFSGCPLILLFFHTTYCPIG